MVNVTALLVGAPKLGCQLVHVFGIPPGQMVSCDTAVPEELYSIPVHRHELL